MHNFEKVLLYGGGVVVMEEETIISKEMVLTLLLIFSIFGVIYLYCAGVDSWEKMPFDKQDECIKYYLYRLESAHYMDFYFREKYKTALNMAHFYDESEKKNHAFLNSKLLYGLHCLEELKTARKYFEAALRHRVESYYYQPEMGLAHLMLAFVSSKLGDRINAEKSLERCRKYLESRKDHEMSQIFHLYKKLQYDYFIVKAHLLADRGAFSEALKAEAEGEILRKKLMLNVFPRTVKAQIYKKMGDEKAWQRELERLAELQKKEIEFHVYYNLVSIYEKKKEYEKGVRFIENLITSFGGSSFDLSFFGPDLVRIYEKSGRKDKAEKIRKRIRPLGDDFFKKLKKQAEFSL